MVKIGSIGKCMKSECALFYESLSEPISPGPGQNDALFATYNFDLILQAFATVFRNFYLFIIYLIALHHRIPIKQSQYIYEDIKPLHILQLWCNRFFFLAGVAEIQCTVNAALPKRSINPCKPVKQSRKQSLEAKLFKYIFQ